MSKPHIAICTPIYKSGHPKYFESLGKCLSDTRYDTSIIHCIGDANLDNARTVVFAKYLEYKSQYDWLCMIDCDIEFDNEIVWQLINHPVNVTGAAYCYKSIGPKAGLPVIRLLENEEPNGVNLLRVKYLGGGFIFVRDSFVQKMIDHYNDLKFLVAPNEPLAKPSHATYALWMPMLIDQPAWDGQEYLSEDWAFCERIAQMGESLYLDLCAIIGHWDGDTCYKLESQP